MTKIQLRDGPALSQDAVLFALALERDGHMLSVQQEMFSDKFRLMVSNQSTLTQDQWDGIKRHRAEILALLTYDAPEPR